MPFDFKLMLRMYMKSIFAYHESGFRFSFKRAMFVLSFPVWFGFLEITTWLCLFLDNILFPGYRKITIEKPVFILGFPRSGTTYLHRMLDNDPQFSSLKLWEIMLAPSIIQKEFFLIIRRLDKLLGHPFYRMALKLEDHVFEGSRSMHKISHFEAEEDEIILIHIFASLFLSFMFPFEDFNPLGRFDTEVPFARRKKIMNFYKNCVKRHLYVFGRDKHYLSKNPAASSKINSIYDTFPDAKIICLVRQPFEALPSAISWVTYGINQFNTTDPSETTERIVSLLSHFYTYPIEELDKRPESCQFIETYDNLIKAPDTFVGRIYGRLGFEMSDEYRRYLRNETEKAKNYKSKHKYSLEEFGLTPKQVVEDYKMIFDRFGFDPVA